MTDRDDWNYTNETLAPGQPLPPKAWQHERLLIISSLFY